MTNALEKEQIPEYTGKHGMREVQKTLSAIWRGYSRRLAGSGVEPVYSPTKNESAKYFLMREIYALGRQLISEKPSFDPEDLVAMMRDQPTTRPDVSPGPFHALFMAVYKENDPISGSERWLMARELKYAYRHNISPELLCGFLLQSGTRKEINKKLDNDYIEPAFRHLLAE